MSKSKKVEPFMTVQSLRPCHDYVAAALRAILETRPMKLDELCKKTGVPQECIVQVISDIALCGRNGRYYLRRPNSFCMRS